MIIANQEAILDFETLSVKPPDHNTEAEVEQLLKQGAADWIHSHIRPLRRADLGTNGVGALDGLPPIPDNVPFGSPEAQPLHVESTLNDKPKKPDIHLLSTLVPTS